MDKSYVLNKLKAKYENKKYTYFAEETCKNYVFSEKDLKELIKLVNKENHDFSLGYSVWCSKYGSEK